MGLVKLRAGDQGEDPQVPSQRKERGSYAAKTGEQRYEGDQGQYAGEKQTTHVE